jgi:hypothetical protein
MPMKRAFALGLLLLLVPTARADVAVPGFTSVPRDVEIETDRDYPEYRFWLVSMRGVEPLALAPGKSYRIDGSGRTGSHRVARVVAAPTGVVEELIEKSGTEGARFAINSDKAPAGLLRSDSLDFNASVSPFDRRTRVLDRYRLELTPPDKLSLIKVEENTDAPAEENAGSPILIGVLAAVILVVVAGIGCAGWLLARNVLRPGRRMT